MKKLGYSRSSSCEHVAALSIQDRRYCHPAFGSEGSRSIVASTGVNTVPFSSFCCSESRCMFSLHPRNRQSAAHFPSMQSLVKLRGCNCVKEEGSEQPLSCQECSLKVFPDLVAYLKRHCSWHAATRMTSSQQSARCRECQFTSIQASGQDCWQDQTKTVSCLK